MKQPRNQCRGTPEAAVVLHPSYRQAATLACLLALIRSALLGSPQPSSDFSHLLHLKALLPGLPRAFPPVSRTRLPYSPAWTTYNYLWTPITPTRNCVVQHQLDLKVLIIKTYETTSHLLFHSSQNMIGFCEEQGELYFSFSKFCVTTGHMVIAIKSVKYTLPKL